jgi:glycosyltransferase involved in cell wall biosynthesis
MAGPAIRALELARALSGRVEVGLAAPHGSLLPDGYELPLYTYDPGRPASLGHALGAGGVVVAPPLAPALAGRIFASGRVWIADLVNPEPFEGLEFGSGLPVFRRRTHEILRADRLSFAARSASAFICGNERQRDMWLGFLAAHRRLTGADYGTDRTLQGLIELVPNGLPAEAPRPDERNAIRGVHVPADARIAVWNGGLWDWLDPITVIEAVELLRRRDDRWALVFLGSDRPAGSRHMTMHERARARAAELGLLDAGAAYFAPGWVPYLERGARLLEADVGVCAHPASAETRFAARTRMLDLLWAGLPAVSTAGDEWSERIIAERLGRVAAPGDAEAFAAALEAVVGEDYSAELAAATRRHTWDAVTQSLPALIDAAARRGAARPDWIARGVGARHRLAARVARLARSDGPG